MSPSTLREAYFVPELGVYAGWTAHENSFAADQVFLNEQRDIALLLSGECFVDQEVRSALKRNGHCLEETNNWLVHLYEEEGEQFVEKLNGLFSGLLIDKRQKKAFLFNDRYGFGTHLLAPDRECDLFRERGQGAALASCPN